MNCFQWQNRSSDFLDGTLPGDLFESAKAHLEDCKACHERERHYETIRASIAAQPKTPLPSALREAPLNAPVPRLDVYGRSKWERMPWYARTSLEITGVAAVVLGVVTLVPRVRDLYERSMARRLDAMILAESLSPEQQDLASAALDVPLLRGKTAGGSFFGDSDEFSSGADLEYADFGADAEEEDSGGALSAAVDAEGGAEEIRVGKSQTWRFNLKTATPREARKKVIADLLSLGVAQTTEGLGGIEAPGGILFDLLLPTSVIPELKQRLEKLASLPALTKTEGKTLGFQGEGFTWYKIRAKRKIPAEHARVVIWLSQI